MELQKGDIIELKVERLTYYASTGGRGSAVSTKQFIVSRVNEGVVYDDEEDESEHYYTYSLRPLRKAKKIRGWRLVDDMATLRSGTKPPLLYKVLQVTLLEDDD